ncbi:protein-glutamine glutaminase family protein [Nocardia alni]|uniref:protein-glutamine glutaminase family protein n=1 Tax=Nocardia alni TaxID=2815723 RepID=UPI001C2223E1|nr:protein-glutamine glutaminase family protein [Nocardia alni]
MSASHGVTSSAAVAGDPAHPRVLLPLDTVFRITGMDNGRVTAEVVPSDPAREGVRYIPIGDPSLDPTEAAADAIPDQGRLVGGVRYFSDDAARENFAHTGRFTDDQHREPPPTEDRKGKGRSDTRPTGGSSEGQRAADITGPDTGTAETTRPPEDSDTPQVPEQPYAQALGAMLAGPGPVDFARVLTILRHNTIHGNSRLFEATFAGERAGTLPNAVRHAIEQRRMTRSQAQRMTRLMGRAPAQTLPADAPAPPRTAARPGQAPEKLPEVRAYVQAIRSAPTPEAVVALVEQLDRNPRKLWAIQEGYLQPEGRDLAEDLRTALPKDTDYIDHLFAEPPARSTAWEPGSEPVPVEWHTARKWFEHIETMSFEHWTGDHPVPHDYLDTGCVQLAHHVTLELIRLGTHPRKILVNGADLRARQVLPDGSVNQLNWDHHVANLVYTRDQDGHADWMVWDPAVARTPVPIRDWLTSIHLDPDKAEHIEGPVGHVIDTFDQRRADDRAQDHAWQRWTTRGYLRNQTVVVTDAHTMALAPGHLLPPHTDDKTHHWETLRELDRALVSDDSDARLLHNLDIMARRNLGGQVRKAVGDYLDTREAEGTPPAESDIVDIVHSMMQGNPARADLLEYNPALTGLLRGELRTRFDALLTATRDSDADHDYASQLTTLLTGAGPVDFRALLDNLRQATARRDHAFLQAAYQSAYKDRTDRTVRLADAVRHAHAEGLLTSAQASRVARLMGWAPDAVPAAAPAPPRIVGEQPENLPEVRRYAHAVWEQIDAHQAETALALVTRLDRDPRALSAVQSAYRDVSEGRELLTDLHTALPDEHDYIDHVFARPPAKLAIWGPDSTPTPVQEDTALDWIRGLDRMTFEDENGDQPLSALDVGSPERAHRTALELTRLGAYPRRVIVSGEGIQYVGNLVYTVEFGIPDWQVFDPALGRTPFSLDEVLVALKVPRAALTRQLSGPATGITETLAALRAQDPTRWTAEGDPLDPMIVITDPLPAHVSPEALGPTSLTRTISRSPAHPGQAPTYPIDTERWRPLRADADDPGLQDAFVLRPGHPEGRPTMDRGSRSGIRQVVRYDLTTEPNEWKFRLRVHLKPGAGATDSTLAEIMNKAGTANQSINQDIDESGLELPGTGAKMSSRVEFVDDPRAAHLVVEALPGLPSEDLPMNQLRWFAAVPPKKIKHEIMHSYGPQDSYRLSRGLLRPTGPRAQARPGDLMGHLSDDEPYTVLDDHLAQIIEVAAPFLPAHPDIPRPGNRQPNPQPPADEQAHDEFDLPPEVNQDLLVPTDQNRVVESEPGIIVYHTGELMPTEAFENGIPPKNPDNPQTIQNHVSTTGKTQFVSTSMDPTYIHKHYRWRYKVRTSTSGVDVAETFALQGHRYVFNWEKEVAFTEAIPAEDIMEVLDRRTGEIIPNPSYRHSQASP